ncbi:MAG: Deoxyribodipyrimidine photolyase, single-strand-specific, partial [uncultured Thiotrichaceae bacterium]
MKNAVYWFTHDLRLADNPALLRAVHSEQNLSFVYCLDPVLLRPNHFNCTRLGKHRHRFIIESLTELDRQLNTYGQHLNVYYQSPLSVFEALYDKHQVRRIYHSVNAGYNERRFFEQIADSAPDITLNAVHSHTLFEPADLPFKLNDLPATFSKFRKLVEKDKLTITPPANAPKQLPPPLFKSFDWLKTLREPDSGSDPNFNGGPLSGQQHLSHYFAEPFAQTYKETRNSLDGWADSTKFSVWLAQGCISPRQIISELRSHEARQGENDSTYWIFFELLWREYFQWYAHAHGAQLFHYRGINNYNPLTSFYGERFQRWCKGNTPYPIVNASMKQLNATGYMSNRGRQLVASCFIHELKLDWRYGAAYFEQQLIDYDVAANWGNWQYLAGVGADPRGSRRFNLEKQTQTYDP